MNELSPDPLEDGLGPIPDTRPRAPAFPRSTVALLRNFFQALGPWRNYQERSPLCILVLGMHRSGTSCIARMVNLCGASVGNHVAGANWSNKAGHWEAREGIEINDGLLRLSGGSWDDPPAKLLSDARLRWKMRGFLGRLHADGTSVWKDPRTVVTFPLWRPLLARYLPVAVFRHPMSVAQSLKRRENRSLAHGLKLWRQYNQLVLEACQDSPNCVWIDFDRGLDHILQRMGRIAGAAGLHVSPQVAESYTEELRTSDAEAVCLDAETAALYSELTKRAQD